MVFMPSQEIHDRLRSERAGVFIDRSRNEPHRWLIAKLQTNLIREIVAGASASLPVWVVNIDDKLILSFGLTIYDDAAAPCTSFGSCRSDEEAADLRVLLAKGAFPVQFHNENFLPLLYAECLVDPALAQAVLQLAPSVGYPEEEGLQIRERANDVIEIALSGKSDSRVKASCDMPVTFAYSEPIRVHLAGIGEVNLADANEGGELEQLTFQAFEHLFPSGVFISPQIGQGKKRRELCDVLAVSRVREVEAEGIFVVQNKVASAYPRGLKRTTARRAKSIENNILDAVGQLRGAIKALKSGETVYRIEDGSSIEVDPPGLDFVGDVEPLNLKERVNQIGQGLVVISDMHDGVDWDKVFYALGKVWLETRYYCQVLDLQELARLISHSNRRPTILEGLLLRRGQVMVEKKNPLVRFEFKV